MNHIVIKGRLTREPEMRYTKSGKQVCNCSIAVKRRFKNNEADFFSVQAWEKTAEFICTYFRKGQEIILSGEMVSEQYEGKNGKATKWYINAQTVDFCGPKLELSKSDPPDINFDEIRDEDEDLPF